MKDVRRHDNCAEHRRSDPTWLGSVGVERSTDEGSFRCGVRIIWGGFVVQEEGFVSQNVRLE